MLDKPNLHGSISEYCVLLSPPGPFMSSNPVLEISQERFRPDEMSMREAPVDNLSPILTPADNALFFNARGDKKGANKDEGESVLGQLINEGERSWGNFAGGWGDSNFQDKLADSPAKSEKGSLLDFGDMASLYGLKEVEQRRNIDNYTRGASAEQRALADENTFQHVFGKAA